MKKPVLYNTLRKAASVLLFIVSLNALAAGYSFMAEPDGQGIGISTDYLRPSAPFQNFLIPGVVLFVVIGILSIVVGVSALVRWRHYPLLILMQGGVFVGWIAVQLTMVTTFHPLHLIIASTGVVLMIIGWILQKRKGAIRAVY